ncbi:MAG: DUF1109 domain-containing protein [Pseudomonadota bacterium]
MKTDELIDRLSADLEPAPPWWVTRRVLIGLGSGAFFSAVLMVLWLGVRPDLMDAMTGTMFWMKFAYTLACSAVLAAALIRVARPGGSVRSLAWALAAPFGLVGLMAVVRLAGADAATRQAMLMGDSADVCPWRIVILSLPILAGAVWALRGLAPTRLVLSGLVAGGCAGAMGAWIYAFHCNESAAAFIAIWYTAGMAAVAVLGALVGRRLLRW